MSEFHPSAEAESAYHRLVRRLAADEPVALGDVLMVAAAAGRTMDGLAADVEAAAGKTIAASHRPPLRT